MRLSMLNRCNCRNEKTKTAKVNGNSNVARKVVEISKMFTGENTSFRNYRATQCVSIGYNQTRCRLVLSPFVR